MPQPPKIATCCYCGTRAALVLNGDVRHELACANCGAPLHEMKKLRKSAASSAPEHRHARMPDSGRDGYRAAPPRRHAKRKRRKSLFSKVLEEAFDVIEDLLD